MPSSFLSQYSVFEKLELLAELQRLEEIVLASYHQSHVDIAEYREDHHHVVEDQHHVVEDHSSLPDHHLSDLHDHPEHELDWRHLSSVWEYEEEGDGLIHSDDGHSVVFDEDEVCSCCPLVVDPWPLALLVGLIGAGTAVLSMVFTRNLAARRSLQQRLIRLRRGKYLFCLNNLLASCRTSSTVVDCPTLERVSVKASW